MFTYRSTLQGITDNMPDISSTPLPGYILGSTTDKSFYRRLHWTYAYIEHRRFPYENNVSLHPPRIFCDKPDFSRYPQCHSWALCRNDPNGNGTRYESIVIMGQ